MSIQTRFGTLYGMGSPGDFNTLAARRKVLGTLEKSPGIQVFKGNELSKFASFLSTQEPEQDQLVLRALMENGEPFVCDPNKGAEALAARHADSDSEMPTPRQRLLGLRLDDFTKSWQVFTGPRS